MDDKGRGSDLSNTTQGNSIRTREASGAILKSLAKIQIMGGFLKWAGTLSFDSPLWKVTHFYFIRLGIYTFYGI